jgi:predicted transcriptional regulator
MAGTTSLKIPDELKEKVADLARGVAQTPHAYMVDAIAERVARDEKRQQLLGDARRSRGELDRTGMAYRFDDYARYLRAKVAGGNPRRPKPVKVKKPRSPS